MINLGFLLSHEKCLLSPAFRAHRWEDGCVCVSQGHHKKNAFLRGSPRKSIDYGEHSSQSQSTNSSYPESSPINAQYRERRTTGRVDDRLRLLLWRILSLYIHTNSALDVETMLSSQLSKPILKHSFFYYFLHAVGPLIKMLQTRHALCMLSMTLPIPFILSSRISSKLWTLMPR
jgi:hypothetical protein